MEISREYVGFSMDFCKGFRVWGGGVGLAFA